MAVNTPLFKIAAAVAAIGAFCSFKSHRHPLTADTDTNNNERYSRQNEKLNGKSKEERLAALMFAPRFDGVHCYETLIRH